MFGQQRKYFIIFLFKYHKLRSFPAKYKMQVLWSYCPFSGAGTGLSCEYGKALHFLPLFDSNIAHLERKLCKAVPLRTCPLQSPPLVGVQLIQPK